MNKALLDANLSDKEFRLLYLFVNNMSMNDTNEIEMYNGFIMDKLNICERQVRRLTSSLVEKGYITKVNTGTKNNRNANVYRLGDIVVDISGDKMCDISGDKNVPPYNTSIINKNISVYTGTSTRGDKNVRGEDTMNISVQVEDNTNVCGNEYDDGTCGDDVDTSIVVKDAGTTPQVKLSKDEIRRRNDYISTVYKRLNTKLDLLYSLSTYSMYVDEVDTIAKIITEAQGHRDWFTSKQWDKLTWYCERFVKITEVKDNYFNGGTKKNADAATISVDDEHTGTNFNDGSDDSTFDNPNPAPIDWGKVNAWVETSVREYTDYASWEKQLDRILAKKYGNNWENAPYRIMFQAASVYNRCARIANDYFRQMEDNDPSDDNIINTSAQEIPSEPQGSPLEDVAPWDEPLTPSDKKQAHRDDLTQSEDDEDMEFGAYVEKSVLKLLNSGNGTIFAGKRINNN